MIHIKFFAYIRQSVGESELMLEHYDGKTALEIKQALVDKGPKWHILENTNTIVAVNHVIKDESVVVNSGDELAFFPPVTGG